jgi:hypothetical protein
MNTGITHPFDGSLYELLDDGTIKITDGKREGLFQRDGQWISGDIREADPQLCVWITNVVDDNATESDSHLAQG